MVSCDEMAESSLLVDALELNSSADSISPDDLAWVDSCLVKDPDISNVDWSSMKDALVDILGLQPESYNSLATTSNGTPDGPQVTSRSSEAGNMLFLGGTGDDDHAQTKEEQDMNYDHLPTIEETATSSSQPFTGDLSETSLKNVFQPNYREDDPRGIDPIDSGLSFKFLAEETEPSTEDIFRVWDLGIPGEQEEEDELVKQLNKALSESSVEAEPSASDDSGKLNDFEEESLDNLIASISDLSLDQHSN